MVLTMNDIQIDLRLIWSDVADQTSDEKTSMAVETSREQPDHRHS